MNPFDKSHILDVAASVQCELYVIRALLEVGLESDQNSNEAAALIIAAQEKVKELIAGTEDALRRGLEQEAEDASA